MAVRLFHWNELDIYRFYNLHHKDYPNLPPPPNPEGLRTFMLACIEATVNQLNEENDPKAGKGKQPRSQRHENQPDFPG